MGALGKLFSPSIKPEPVTRMPDPDSPDVLNAKRKKRADLLAQKGRQSTILTDEGAPTYQNTVLGQ